MKEPRLFMLLLGCRPAGRLTEQHDVFFGIANSLKELVPAVRASWREAKGNIHIDAWREVQQVGSYQVRIEERGPGTGSEGPALFFFNLGGYKPGEFDEFHYKLLVVGKDKAAAVEQAKQTAFYTHTGFGKEAVAHIDDRYGVDVDDAYEIKDILPPDNKLLFQLRITKGEGPEDLLHLGYFPLDKLPD